MKNIFNTRRVRPNEVIIHNNYSTTIPASSFARITSYDKTNQHFNVDRPDADFMDDSIIVVVPEAIVNDKIGLALIDGIMVVKKTSGESPAVGDVVGTDEDKFTAIVGGGGGPNVIYVDGDYIVIRRTPLSVVRKAYCKTDASTGTTLVCYLDTDATGPEITVNFSIAQGGSNLNTAIPLLLDGDLIFVSKIDGTWYCTSAILNDSKACACS